MKKRAPLGQTRVQSGLETLITNIIGFGSSIALQMVLLPWYGIHIHIAQNILITTLAYSIALPRSYALRRLFNRWHAPGGQPKWQSSCEAGIDLALGYASSVLMHWFLFPVLGYNVSLVNNAQISAVFYLFAYVRKFILRRAFNRFWFKS